ncbi:MAG: hypothetical protein JSW28_04245 [Thermoplasmata archaeon]|nr:MAG: hypothetical protein JSW28_04245 [Thermoplasmata archaeon]
MTASISAVSARALSPPDKFRNKVEEFYKKFKVISWREDMFKDGGRSRLGK